MKPASTFPMALRRGFRRVASLGATAQPGRALLAAALAALPLAAQAALPAAALQPVLAELDQRFERGDVAGYLAQFAPDHARAHQQLGRELAAQRDAGAHPRRTTTLVGEPRRLRDRTVVRVRHEFSSGDPQAGTVATRYALLAFAERSGRPPLPTFCVALPSPEPDPLDGRFACPPCNLAFGGAPGWLCVPQSRSLSQALDAATFYLVGADLACDLAVHLGPATADQEPAVAASAAAEALASALRAASGSHALRVLPEPWILPVAPGATDAATAAGARVSLVPSGGDASAEQFLIRVAVQGPLQHCLVVRGSRAAFASHAAAIDALLATYRLLDPSRVAAAAADAAVEHHSGGGFDGSVYHNPLWRVACTGPAGWRPEQRAGGALFRVLWTSPRGSRLWLHGYEVPAGMTQWCKASAEAWCTELCRQRGLAFADATRGWDGTDDCQEYSRSWQARTAQPGSVLHQFRLLVRNDLLVLADGVLQHADDGAALQAALATVRLH